MKPPRRKSGIGVIGGLLLLAVLATTALAQAEPERGAAETPGSAVPAGDPWGQERPEGTGASAGPGAEAALRPAPLAEVPRGSVERVWLAPSESLEVRVDQTRRAALEVGAWNLDPAARALIRGASEGSPLDRARAAVRLSPDLPAAHMSLARALWIQESAPMDAIRAVVAAFEAVGHHAEASLWFAGSALYLVSVALIGGAFLLILWSALSNASHAAHDVAHLLRVRVPGFARFACLGTLLLVPVALGEGWLGLSIALLVIGLLYGSNARRAALGLAALSLFCGLYPVPRLAGAALGAFPDDAVARAAYSTAQGLASPVDLARLEYAAEQDPLAMRGLAIHARQMGHLGTADALYQRLLEDAPDDLALINNAANVRLELGHVDSALDLYGRAADIADSPVVLFNLSQAYGRSFQVDELNATLADAQRVDGELVAQLTTLQRTKNENFVVDFPLTARLMWKRTLARGGGEALAAEFRAPFAPGRLGRSRDHVGAVLTLIVGATWLLALRFVPSRWCTRCGGLQCTRCDSDATGDLCESCMRLFNQPEKTDRTLRAERIQALRQRELRIRRLQTLGSILLPGAAGLFAKRPVRGLVAAVCFSFAAAALFWRAGVVPDPLVAGPAAPIAFLGTAVIAAFVYVAIVVTSLADWQES